jgi:hypothetical protein
VVMSAGARRCGDSCSYMTALFPPGCRILNAKIAHPA